MKETIEFEGQEIEERKFKFEFNGQTIDNVFDDESYKWDYYDDEEFASEIAFEKKKYNFFSESELENFSELFSELYYISGMNKTILKEFKELIIKHCAKYEMKKYNLKPIQLIKQIEKDINDDYDNDHADYNYLLSEYGYEYVDKIFGGTEDIETTIGKEFWKDLYSDGSAGDM